MLKLKKLVAHVVICQHGTCRSQGAKSAARAFKRELKQNGLKKRVMVSKVKCLDQCGRGPVFVVYPEGTWYGGVDEKAARLIVEHHLVGGTPVEAKILHEMSGD